jgi:hypothetical protein
MLVASVATDDAMRWRLTVTGVHRRGAETVPVLSSGCGRAFPSEVHRLTLKQFLESARNLEGFGPDRPWASRRSRDR